MATSGAYKSEDLIPTPTATDAQMGKRKSTQQKEGSKHSMTLRDAIEPLLPTPEARNSEGYQVANGKQYPRLGRVVSTSSRAVSPANPSPKPDEEKERQTTATSGLRCYGLFESSNPDGSSVKMLRDYLLSSKAWYSSKSALTWKRKDTRFSRLLFQLSPSMRHIEGTGSGLLATPNTMDSMQPKTEKAIIIAYGQMLPTPDANAGKRGTSKEWKPTRVSGQHAQLTLNDKIKMIPTPSARELRDNVDSLIERGGTKGMAGTKTGLKLQPSFVAWMMGYPLDWLDFPTEEKSPIPNGGKKPSKD